MLVSFQDAKLEILSVRLFTSFGSLDDVNVYNPCLNVSLAEFIHVRDQLCSFNVLIGDFNAHSPLWDERGRLNITGKSLELYLALHSHGILNEYYSPNFTDLRTGATSCLDLCLPSLPLLSKGSMSIGSDVGSDHLPIECTFGISLHKTVNTGSFKRLLKHGKWSCWTIDLSASTFSCVLPASVIDLSKDVCSRLLDACLEHIPQ